MSGHQPEVVFGVRLARHLGVYVIGSIVVLIISFVNVFVMTRLLPRGQYGTLTLLVFWSTLLMTLFNLGTMQGTLRAVFGATGDDDVDGEEEDVDPEEVRGSLGSGVVFTFLIGFTGLLIIIPMASNLSGWILGDPEHGDWIILAATAAMFAALSRLVTNVLRLERRPVAYVFATALRPCLILGPMIVLVSAGHGVGGALVGMAIGMFAEWVVVMLLTRSTYKITLEREMVVKIINKGKIVVPVVAALWVVQNADVFMLSRYVSHSDLAPYRVAAQFGVAVTVCTRGFFYAWAPLQRETSFVSLAERHGRETMRGAMVTYFVLMCLTMLIGLTVAASTFALVAPSDYSQLSLLIPLVAGGFFVHGTFVVIYRASQYPTKLRNYAFAALLSVVGFVGGVIVFVPWIGVPGAALAVMLGFAMGFTVLFTASQRSEDPIPVQYKNIAGAVLLAAAIIVAGTAANAPAGRYELLLSVGCAILFLGLSLVLGIVPRGHQAPLRRVLGSLARLRAGHIDPEEALASLTPEDRQILQLAVVHRRTPEQIGQQLERDVDDIRRHLVESLRKLSTEFDGSTEHDPAIGQYLFFQESIAQRDAMRFRLWSAEVNPDDVRELEATIEVLGRAPDEAWKQDGEDEANGHRRRKRRLLSGVGRR